MNSKINHCYNEVPVMYVAVKKFSCAGTEAEIQLPLKRSSRFQCLFPNPSWLV